MDRVFGTYILEERIGVGGMGEVYRATKNGPEGFRVRVALKLILPHLAQEESFRRLFSREARLAALLKHPNIVNVNGFDILDGIPFIEMEYIEGSDLASLLKKIGNGETLATEESVYILYCAARGLAYAHSFEQVAGSGSGIVHRDFNPHNLLISVEGEVKITDFGIARAAMGGTAASGTLMGKLAYMSPEQIEVKLLDHRSDLFSFGIMAYQLLTGRHPFSRAGEAGTVRAVQEASYRPLADSAPSLPSSLVDIIESLLSASPEDRPGTARHVADVFEEYLKPAGAKMLGRRVRSLTATGRPAPVHSPTGPTLAPGSRKVLAWSAAVFVLTAVALVWLLKIGEPPVETGMTLKDGSSFGTASAEVVHHPVTENTPDPVSVLVNTAPAGAPVHEGDTLLGHTPLTVEIPPDVRSRELTVSRDGYEPAEISLTKDDSRNGLMLALTPLSTGTARIGAIPWARVSFRGEEMGVTPMVIKEAPVGTHSLVLYNDELETRWEVEMSIREGINPAFVVDMATGEAVHSPE